MQSHVCFEAHASCLADLPSQQRSISQSWARSLCRGLCPMPATQLPVSCERVSCKQLGHSSPSTTPGQAEGPPHVLLSQQFCRYARSRGAVHSELALPVNRCAAVLLVKGV